MNNRQRATLDSCNRVSIFLTNHTAELAVIIELPPEEAAFNLARAAINSAGAIQLLQEGKKELPVNDNKQAMVQTILQFAFRGAVKARQLGNIALANQLDVPASFILRSSKTESVQRARNLRNLLNDNLGTLTNIGAGDITTIDAAIDTYDAIKDEPVHNRQVKKATGTDVLPDAFEKADTAIRNIYLLLIAYFGVSHPELVDEFRLCMEIIDTGLHHTSTDITIVADATGNPIANANITDTSNGKTYTSDANGLLHIPTHRNGQFTFTIEANGYQTVSFTADIKRGVQNEFTVRLIAV